MLKTLTLVVLVAATLVQSALAQEQKTIKLEPQDLATAIRSLADQTGIQVLFAAEDLKGIKSQALEGTMPADEALTRLLAGTGYSFKATGPNTYVIERAAREPSKPTELPEVNVTAPPESAYAVPNATAATKTDTPIMETPVSVQVVPQQVLKDQQVTRIDDALLNVTGVIPSGFGSGNGDAFTIRGFDIGGLTYEDGLKLDQSTTAGFQRDLANIERIEVVKGPASVLYGQAEPGGLVNIVTKKPLDHSYYSLEQQAGSFDFYRTTLDATGPLNTIKTLLYRFNLAYENDGSFRDFIHRDRLFLFPTFQWKASDQTQATLELKYATGTEDVDFGIPFVNGKPAAIPLSRNLVEPDANREPTDEYSIKLLASHEFNENWALRLAYKSEYHSQPVPNFQVYAGEPDAAGNLTRFGFPEEYFRQWTHQGVVDLTGKFDTFGVKHTAIIGFDYYYQVGRYAANFIALPSINIYNPVYGQPYPPPNPANEMVVHNGQNAYGAYLQDQMALPWNVHLLAGFRYDQSRTFDNGYTAAATVTDHPPLTPRFGVLWQAIPQVSLYGSYTSNYGDTPLGDVTQNGAPLPPQSAQQYELGIKTELFEKRLSATASVYQLTKQNIPTTDPTNPLFTIAVGEARSRGVELEIAGEMMPGWRIIGGYSYIDAVVTKDNSGLEGMRFAGVPLNSGSLWSTYEIQDGRLKGLKIGAGLVARTGEVDFSNEKIPGFAIANAMASYNWHVGKTKVSAQLNINNLFDNKDYFSGLTTSSAFPGAPVSFLGSLRVEL